MGYRFPKNMVARVEVRDQSRPDGVQPVNQVEGYKDWQENIPKITAVVAAHTIDLTVVTSGGKEKGREELTLSRRTKEKLACFCRLSEAMLEGGYEPRIVPQTLKTYFDPQVSVGRLREKFFGPLAQAGLISLVSVNGHEGYILQCEPDKVLKILKGEKTSYKVEVTTFDKWYREWLKDRQKPEDVEAQADLSSDRHEPNITIKIETVVVEQLSQSETDGTQEKRPGQEEKTWVGTRVEFEEFDWEGVNLRKKLDQLLAADLLPVKVKNPIGNVVYDGRAPGPFEMSTGEVIGVLVALGIEPATLKIADLTREMTLARALLDLQDTQPEIVNRISRKILALLGEEIGDEMPDFKGVMRRLYEK